MDNNNSVNDCIQLCNMLRDDMNSYDGILIGLGTELFKSSNTDIDDTLNKLAVYLEHKNYFIISSVKNDVLRKSSINQKRIVCPYLSADEFPDNSDSDNENEDTDNVNVITEERQWNLYNKWLSGTLAKKLLVIEIGEGFNNPNLIKWPFERIVMINDKARFYRIHSMFYQIPPEIKDKSVTYKKNSYEVLKTLVNIVK